MLEKTEPKPEVKPKAKAVDFACSVSLPLLLVNRIAFTARKERRTQSAVMDNWCSLYLKSHKLEPLPEGTRLKRTVVGTGEKKIQKYLLTPDTYELLKEAQELGYSRSYIIEEAVKEGLADA